MTHQDENAITAHMIAAPDGLTKEELQRKTYGCDPLPRSQNHRGRYDAYNGIRALMSRYNKGLVYYAPPGRIIRRSHRYYHVAPDETTTMVILPTALLRDRTPVLIGIGDAIFAYRVQDGRLVREAKPC